MQTENSEVKENTKFSGIWGKIGLFFGIIGVLLIVSQYVADSLKPHPQNSSVLHSIIKDFGTPVTTNDSAITMEKITINGSKICAGLALILGIISWVIKENERLSKATIALSVVIAIYHAFIIAIIVCLLCVIIYAFFTYFGDS